MKLTIGIPNFNGGELLEQTILSCKNLKLDEDDFEILIVDNISDDNSVEKVNNLKSTNKNIRLVINDTNVGRIGNWNRVLELAKGERILMLMVGDKLKEFDYDLHFSSLNNNETLVFGVDISGVSSFHWAQKINTFLDSNILLKSTILTLGHNYGLTPLQTHFLSRDIIRKNNLKFNDKYDFLADLNFLNEYISYFERVKFVNHSILSWWNGKNKTTFKKQLLMFEDYINYFPIVFEKFTGKSINIFLFNIYIVNQVFFIYLNNKRIGIKGFSFFEYINFVKNNLGIINILLILLFPMYIIYLFINLKNNFKYPIKF